MYQYQKTREINMTCKLKANELHMVKTWSDKVNVAPKTRPNSGPIKDSILKLGFSLQSSAYSQLIFSCFLFPDRKNYQQATFSENYLTNIFRYFFLALNICRHMEP